MSCLFCKIANKEIPSEIVHEDENALAFLDINPRAPGHSVIIPRRHAETVLDLDDDLVGPIFLTVKKVVAMLKKTFKPDGFTIGVNQGKAAGQVVDHLHIHVFPRWQNDGGASVHGVVNNSPKESLKEIADKIRNYEHKS